jgi:hypothetical protein
MGENLMQFKNGRSVIRTWQELLKVVGANVILIIIFGACNFTAGLPTVTTTPDMTSWRQIESPLFPSQWPPTAETVWVSYTFAYGSNPTKLNDGAYVTQPLSKTEWKGDVATTTVLSSEKTQAAVQGVLPLDSQASATLGNGNQVSAYCLNLTELPDLNKPETKAMLAYYQAWFKYNGAFLGLIREKHADFISWIAPNQ